MKIQNRRALRDNWTHLRIPFQMTLAPIFLWGWFVSDTPPSWQIVPCFVAFHFFLYTEITAYNSYYDRDEGPIGDGAAPDGPQRSSHSPS